MSGVSSPVYGSDGGSSSSIPSSVVGAWGEFIGSSKTPITPDTTTGKMLSYIKLTRTATGDGDLMGNGAGGVAMRIAGDVVSITDGTNTATVTVTDFAAVDNQIILAIQLSNGAFKLGQWNTTKKRTIRNLFAFSESLTNYTSKVGADVTANTFYRNTTGPSYLKVNINASTAGLTTTVGKKCTYTCAVKRDTCRYVSMRVQGTYPARVDVVFDVLLGVIKAPALVYGGFVHHGTLIKPNDLYPDYYDCTITVSPTSETVLAFYLSCGMNYVVVDGNDNAVGASMFVKSKSAVLIDGTKEVPLIEYIKTTSGSIATEYTTSQRYHKRVSVWGDSMSANSSGFFFALSQLIPETPMYDGGVGGEDTTEILPRMAAAIDKYDDVVIIAAGRNNFADIEQVLADIADMVSRVTSRKYLILSVFNAGDEGIGTVDYTNVMALNAALRSAHPDNYLDGRSYIVSCCNTSGQDVLDHSLDVPPTSLRRDITHLNEAGNALYGTFVRNELARRGWANLITGGESIPPGMIFGDLIQSTGTLTLTQIKHGDTATPVADINRVVQSTKEFSSKQVEKYVNSEVIFTLTEGTTLRG